MMDALDTFERKLQTSLKSQGVDISAPMAVRIAHRVPRFIDCSGPSEPLMLTREAVRVALGEQGVWTDERCYTEVATALLPYISVLDSNLE